MSGDESVGSKVQPKEMIAKSIKRMENMRKGLLANRDQSLLTVREKQQEIFMRIIQMQRVLQERRELIRAQGASINLRGEVGQKIDRGLIELQSLVQSVRDALMGRDTSELMKLEPSIQGEIEAEANKIIESEFFRTLVKQLKKESDSSA